MPLNCLFQELDTETRDYLLAVHQAKGRGSPGIYVSVGNSKPMMGCILGPIIAIGVFVFSLSSDKDAWAVALLQTAGVLLGGWLFVYAFRRWSNSGSVQYPGYFLVFDPLHIYEVMGENVRVTALRGVAGVEAIGTASAPQIRFEFNGQKPHVVTMPTVVSAELVETYYDALDRIERGKVDAFANADVGEQGAAAVHVAMTEEFPANLGDINLEIPTVPLEPAKGNRAAGGIVGILAILVVGAAVFLLFWQSNQVVHDELAFENAKANGASGLRGYLIDPRNVRHREEAQTLLSHSYDSAVAKLRSNLPGTNPKLREAMSQLVDSLRTADQAVLSINVKLQGNLAGAAAEDHPQTRQEIADSLARSIGTDKVAFVDAPPGKPAHIEVTYHTEPDTAPGQFGKVILVMDVSVRKDISAAPIAKETVKLPNLPAGPIETFRFVVSHAVLKELVGEVTNAPPPDLGEF